jgi:hypothetical protein
MTSRSRVPRPAARIVLPLLTLVIAGALAGCGGSSSGSSSVSFTGSGYPGVDAANTRNPKSEISSANVAELSPSWTASIPGTSNFGSYAGAPVIVNGVI